MKYRKALKVNAKMTGRQVEQEASEKSQNEGWTDGKLTWGGPRTGDTRVVWHLEWKITCRCEHGGKELVPPIIAQVTY